MLIKNRVTILSPANFFREYLVNYIKGVFLYIKKVKKQKYFYNITN